MYVKAMLFHKTYIFKDVKTTHKMKLSLEILMLVLDMSTLLSVFEPWHQRYMEVKYIYTWKKKRTNTEGWSKRQKQTDLNSNRRVIWPLNFGEMDHCSYS